MADLMSSLIDIFFHLDVHLHSIVSTYGVWVYAILFIVIFCETGLIFMPFLPGDSLLFAVGTLAALGSLDIQTIAILLMCAAVIGDSVNYWMGHRIGPKIFTRPSGFFFHQDHLRRAEKFYEKHGGKAIILARFMPIIRTFAPFVAGVGNMHYTRFLVFNITGAVLWVGGFIFAGYFFGNIPTIKENFHYVILGIIVASLLPPLYHATKEMVGKNSH